MTLITTQYHWRLSLAGLGLALLPLATAVEPPASNRLEFEVASIKLADPGAKRSGLSARNGNDLLVENWPIRNLIKFAYSLQDFQLAGGPKWIESERYSIVAKAPRDESILKLPEDRSLMTEEQFQTRGERLRARVRSLLADRFGLVLRNETRSATVFRLVQDKGGAKVKLVEKPGERQGVVDNGKGRIEGIATTIEMFAHDLSTIMQSPVRDETGLTGKYDFVLEWAREEEKAVPIGSDSASPDNSGPSLGSALRGQLGLRLYPERGSVDVVVVDQITRPAAN
jgi:uncharacterized protein (TIGR03435 family)